jgi:hypothetical protein
VTFILGSNQCWLVIRFFFINNMYNSWICINAYLDFVSISIIDIICNWHVCTRFISLSYSYLNEIINVLYPYHIHNRLKQVLNGDDYGC